MSKKNDQNLLAMMAAYFNTHLPGAAGCGGNTIAACQYAFRLLFEFLSDKKGVKPERVEFGTLTENTLLEFLAWLEDERKCSTATRNLRLSALKSFARYCLKRAPAESAVMVSALLSIPAKRAVTGKPIKYFTREEIRVLLAIPDVAKKTGRRDKVLMSALYATGARASEICELTVGGVIFAAPPGLTRVRLHGKGDKWRTVTVASNCADLLKRHMELEGLGAPGTQARHVFSTQSHECMSVVCVEEIVKKHVTAAKKRYPGLFREGSYSPHSFRHSIAMHKLEAGDSLIEIKAFLGHEKIETTMEYAKVTPELAAKFLLDRDIPDDAREMENKKSAILDAMPFLENRRLKK